MPKQVILRPVFNRPEMLKLSIEYEIQAREFFSLPDELTTIFIVEHGSPKETLQLVEEYPFKKAIIKREKMFGLSKNILEGMKSAFKQSDDFIIYIEDDILVHKTYFQYMSVLLNHPDIPSFSVLSPNCGKDSSRVGRILRDNHYGALAPLIDKRFYTEYIAPHSIEGYYRNPYGYIIELNKKYQEYWRKDGEKPRLGKWKVSDGRWNEQAGLINRLVDAMIIDEDIYLYRPVTNRQVHIGYYGKNRRGGNLPGATFDARFETLKKIITDPKKMFEHGGGQYNDYKTFSPALKDWDGVLHLYNGKRPANSSL